VALLTFPFPATNGQVYPVSPPAGTNIYQYVSAEQTWRLLGPASGVTAGTYGTPLSVPQITIDATGRITVAVDVPIQLGDTTQVGLVQLTDDTISNDPTTALTAAQGYKLQNEIGDTSLLNPFYPNLVTAINALGAPSGVTAGTYGNGSNVGQFTVNAQGRIISAINVPLALATTIAPGVIRVGANLAVTGTGVLSVPNATTATPGAVQLVNNTTTNDATKALTAAAGFNLQQQIDNINIRNNLTFGGTINGTTGAVTSVSPEGAAIGLVIGSQLPAPSAVNDEYYVVVTVAGSFTPPASPAYTVNVGDWLVSDGSQWILFAFNLGSVTRVNTGTGLTGGPITSTGTISLRPATTSSLGGVIPDGTTITVSPSGVISGIAAPSFRQIDDISGSFNGTTKTFPIRVGGVAYTPGSSSNLIVSLGGVVQIPGSAFSVSGSNITFDSAPPTSTTFVGYVVTAGGSGGGGGGGGGGSVTSVGTGVGLTGGTITTTGTISLVPATTAALGGVIPDGTTITVSPSGVISAVGAATPSLQTVTNTGATTTNAITVAGLTSNGAVIPGANDTYDLGSATRRWRDLYVSSNSIYMGTNQLTVSGGVLLINGTPVGGGGSVGTLQTVTDNGATTTNTISVNAGPGIFTTVGSTLQVRLPTVSQVTINEDSVRLYGSSGGIQAYATLGAATPSVDIRSGSGNATFTGQLQASGLTYPATDGTAGQVLSTDGAGTLSWVTAGGGSVGDLQTVTDNGAQTTNGILAGGGLTVAGVTGGGFQIQTVGAAGIGISDTVSNITATITGTGTGSFNGGIVAGNPSTGTGGAIIVGNLTVQDTSYQRFTVNGNTGKVNIGNNSVGAGGTPGIDIYTAGLTPPSISLDGVTGKIELVDTVTGSSSIKMEPQTGLISILPQSLGDPGFYISPTGPYFGNSAGNILAGGTFPAALAFNGSVGTSIKTASSTIPVQLWAGGQGGVATPQLSVTGTFTSISNILRLTDSAQTTTWAEIRAIDSSNLSFVVGPSNNTVLLLNPTLTTITSNLQMAGYIQVNSPNGIRFYESSAVDYVGLTAPSSLGASYNLTLPPANGTADQVLATDGSGTLGWITTAKVVATPGSSAAGGNDNEISFDAAGNFYFFKGGSWWKVAGSSF
jgi:hypothetical protein